VSEGIVEAVMTTNL